MAPSMSITIVYYIDSQAFGGAEQVLYNLLARLDRDVWHPVLVYHPSDGIAAFEERVEGLGVETLSLPRKWHKAFCGRAQVGSSAYFSR